MKGSPVVPVRKSPGPVHKSPGSAAPPVPRRVSNPDKLLQGVPPPPHLLSSVDQQQQQLSSPSGTHRAANANTHHSLKPQSVQAPVVAAAPLAVPPVPRRQMSKSATDQRDLYKFPSFKVTLASLMASQSRVVPDEVLPKIFTTLVSMIVANKGLASEGIFRLSGSVAEVARLRATLDKGAFNVEFSGDPNTPACVLKQWIGELQEPLVPPVCAEALLANVHDASPEQLQAAVDARLPVINARVLKV
jgi:hypothetical protein